MSYVYSYSIASIVFLGITFFFYFSNSRLHNFEDKFFAYLLFGSTAAIVFDLLGAIGDQFPGVFPRWALYLINIIGIGSLHFCQPCFCMYLYKANDERKFIKRRALFATFLPYMIILFLLFVSTFSRSGLFYIDEGGIYRRGASYNVLFLTSAIYFITAASVMTAYYRRLENRQNLLLGASLVIFAAAAALQYFFPLYLLNTSATALAVCVIHLTLQNPVDRVEASTGCFNRTQLTKLLRRYHERHSAYTLLLFYVDVGDELKTPETPENFEFQLRRAGEFLQNTFPNDAVISMDFAEFTVVCQRAVDPPELRRARERFSVELGAQGHVSPPEISVAVLPSEERADTDTALMMLDYLFRRLKNEKQSGVLVADEEFRRECYEDTVLSATIEALLTCERSSLLLTQLYDKGGRISGQRATLAAASESIGQVCGNRLIQKADEAGLGWKYFSLLLKKLSEHSAELNGDCRAVIPVPASVCLTRFAAQRIEELTSAVGLRKEQLVLSMNERDFANAQASMQENVRDTAELGYTLRLTDFASGFTNMPLFIGMPVDEVELDAGAILSGGGGKTKMLEAVIGLLKGLEKRVICSGVSNEREAEMLFEYGADLIEFKAKSQAIKRCK